MMNKHSDIKQPDLQNDENERNPMHEEDLIIVEDEV